MKKILTIILLSAFFAACGSAGSHLKVKIGDKETSMDVKSTGVFYGNVISTNLGGKARMQTFNHAFYFTNYEADMTNQATMKKTAITSPDQMRVLVSITGEDGTADESPFKVGTYSVKNEYINDVRDASITTFEGGKEVQKSFDTLSMSPKTEGEVKITSVTADSVSGEINLTEGDKSIKGTFTAKLPAAKK